MRHRVADSPWREDSTASRYPGTQAFAGSLSRWKHESSSRRGIEFAVVPKCFRGAYIKATQALVGIPMRRGAESCNTRLEIRATKALGSYYTLIIRGAPDPTSTSATKSATRVGCMVPRLCQAQNKAVGSNRMIRWSSLPVKQQYRVYFRHIYCIGVYDALCRIVSLHQKKN